MIEYFGTALDSKGHFFWECDDDTLRQKRDFSYTEFSEKFFWPETIADDKPQKRNGDIFFFRVNGKTICYITGSCIDNRHGCKSVFFTDEDLTYGELAIKLMATPICRKIIEQMPFEIKWGLRQDIVEQLQCAI